MVKSLRIWVGRGELGTHQVLRRETSPPTGFPGGRGHLPAAPSPDATYLHICAESSGDENIIKKQTHPAQHKTHRQPLSLSLREQPCPSRESSGHLGAGPWQALLPASHPLPQAAQKLPTGGASHANATRPPCWVQRDLRWDLDKWAEVSAQLPAPPWSAAGAVEGLSPSLCWLPLRDTGISTNAHTWEYTSLPPVLVFLLFDFPVSAFHTDIMFH